MKAIDKQYWKKYYAEPEEMDGIVNAQHHAEYLKNYFDIERVKVKSIFDFGFGLGFLFEALVKKFEPTKVGGIEPSDYAYEFFLKRGKNLIKYYDIELNQESLLDWAEKKKKASFDLGICTSVFQYLKEDELRIIIPELKKKIKYLYFSVPTDKEYIRQKEDHNFKDEYAYSRKKEFYYDLLSPHFTFISSRLLESKHYFDEKNTPFTDLLFRF